MISKWARALRYAARRKPAEMRLKSFMKAAGGVNDCAAGYAHQRRRHQRPSGACINLQNKQLLAQRRGRSAVSGKS